MWKSLNRIDRKQSQLRISRARRTEKESKRKRNRTKNTRWTTTTTTTMNDNDKETFNYPIMKNAFIANDHDSPYIFPFAISALGKYWFAASLFPIFSLFFRYFSSLLLPPRVHCLVWIHLSRCLINVVHTYIYTGNGYILNCHRRR